MGLLTQADLECFVDVVECKYADWGRTCTIRNYDSKTNTDMFDSTPRTFTDNDVRCLQRDAEYLGRNKRLEDSVQHNQDGLLTTAEFGVLFLDRDIASITLNKESTILLTGIEYTIIGFIKYEFETLCLVKKVND